MQTVNPRTSRRDFVKYLLASPLLARVREAYAQEGAPSLKFDDPMQWAPYDIGHLVGKPADAQSIFDLEVVAHKNVPPAHWGYLTTGAEGESTLRANRADFQRFALVSHRMRDVTKVDTSVTIFGEKFNAPIFICPTGSNAAFHPDGETAVSRAAGKMNAMQMVSTAATVSMEDCLTARGSPAWFQLYSSPSFEISKSLVERAKAAGYSGVVLTVDVTSNRKNETQARMRAMDKRNCIECHDSPNGGTGSAKKANYSKITPEMWKSAAPGVGAHLTWDFAKRLRDETKMKFVLKGILDPEDAALCVKHGFDGGMVSNHGGRDDDGGWSTIRALPDIVKAVNKKVPILIDSGFRRGTDVVKALAMGATAVGVGRPYLWGLGAFGQPGVERVLEILRTETATAMGQAGCPTVADLRPSMIRT